MRNVRAQRATPKLEQVRTPDGDRPPYQQPRHRHSGEIASLQILDSNRIRIVLPGQPRGKAKKFTTIGGYARGFNDDPTKAYMKALAWQAKASFVGQPLTGPIEMRFQALFKIPKSFSRSRRQDAIDGRLVPTTKPDYDNIAKMIGDALKGIIWEDDCQITDGSWRKRYSEAPALIVEIRQIRA